MPHQETGLGNITLIKRKGNFENVFRDITFKLPLMEDYPKEIQDSATSLTDLRGLCWRVKPHASSSRDRRLFTR